VHPFAREALATCGKGALTPEGSKRITRRPYLQSTTLQSTIVVWGSTDGEAQVVLREPKGEVVATAHAVYAGDPRRKEARLAAQKAGANKLAADNIYVVKAELDNLEPTHLYCYQLFANDVALTEAAPLSTAAAPKPSTPIRFVALGDTGTGGAAQRAIAKRMSEVPYDLILFLGDIAYESGTASQLQHNFFEVYADVLRYVPAYPTIGNHERRTHKGHPFFDAFVLFGAERYYSFEWGDVHFVAIDTTHYDAEQLAWLRDDLSHNKRPWTIVFGHHPPYTSSFRGPQLAVRRAFAKIVTDYKVDLVITGHEHQYERFRVAGVNYVISGGGGGQLNYFWGSSNSLKQAMVHHYLSFEVSENSFVMKAIDIDGKEIETLRLTKHAADEKPKVKVDGKPEVKETPIAPETKTKPDEKIHDEPDGDQKEPKAPEKPIKKEEPVKPSPITQR
jgi:3',5'-cyclic AMP phosphodiesterase CpdA